MALTQTILFLLTTSLLVSAEIKQFIDYRLPQLYKPIAQKIDLTLPPELFTESSNDFKGKVDILFTFTKITNYISLHAHHKFITIKKVKFNNTELSAGNYTVNKESDILTIKLNKRAKVNHVYELVIEYNAVLSTEDMYGFYKSTYVTKDGVLKYLLTTQFSPTFARRAFPCFDEPALKVTFEFIVNAPERLEILFNTKKSYSYSNATSGLETRYFVITKKMSTYLFAFIISDFTCTTGANINYVPFQVCSRDEISATRALALKYGPNLLEKLSDFTNYKYQRLSAKIDLVAIPDFAAGAMENWGLIMYREMDLLSNESEASNRYNQDVVTVIAHELAHQWFGNFITFNWWSELFLSEGFALYFQFFITHELIPDWELDKQFVLEELHPALLVDGFQSVHALQTSTSSPTDIISRFSVITYGKGASIIRMVEHVMSREYFRRGLRNYVSGNEFGTAEPADLWLAFNGSINEKISSLPANLSVIMEHWVRGSGYPVVTVSLERNYISFTQKRFLYFGDDDESRWFIPISYTTSVDDKKFEATVPAGWLTPYEDLKIKLPPTWEWIVLNNQQTGYYRVNYDEDLWLYIKRALLRDNFDGISDLNRAQIVDDLFQLARANQVLYSHVLDVIRFLGTDTSYYSWHAAFSGFTYLLTRVGENSTLGRAVSSDILQLMEPFYRSVPLSIINDDNQMYTLKQVLAVTWACKLGSEDCIAAAKKGLLMYRNLGRSFRPNRNLRSILYCNALRYSNDSRTDWNFYWRGYTWARLYSEELNLLTALGCTKDKVLLKEYLQKTITNNSGIRPQDAMNVFESVYKGSPEGVDVAFEFLMENHKTINRMYQVPNALGIIIEGLTDKFTTESQVSTFRNFIQTGGLWRRYKVIATQALREAEENLRWLNQFKDDLEYYYGLGGMSGWTIALTVIGSILCVLASVYYFTRCGRRVVRRNLDIPLAEFR